MLLPLVPLLFVESEETLHQIALTNVRVVVLHLTDLQDCCAAGRLMRAAPYMRAPVLALDDFYDDAVRGSLGFAFLADVLHVRTERWQSLLASWALHPSIGLERASAIRLLHACAPADLLPVLDTLTLHPLDALSVKQWSTALSVERTRLYRILAALDVTPSQVIDAVRTAFIVGPYLVRRSANQPRAHFGATGRTLQRLLIRTLGLTLSELNGLGEPGSPAVWKALSGRLRIFLVRTPEAPDGERESPRQTDVVVARLFPSPPPVELQVRELVAR